MDLDRYPLPVKFLDFETVQFVIPIWKGTRPFQQIVFQASIDAIDENGGAVE
jgi:hypothetical protein